MTGTLSIPFAGSWGLRQPACRAGLHSPALELSIPFAGSWGLRHGDAESSAMAPVSFNPVCRELGAPPPQLRVRRDSRGFQSRLPGVGGSAPAGEAGRSIGRAFQSRLPGVGGSAKGRPSKSGRRSSLSIPFAGSWGLRLGLAPCKGGSQAPLSIPFAGSWGLRPEAWRRGEAAARFQSRLPGVGGSA